MIRRKPVAGGSTMRGTTARKKTMPIKQGGGGLKKPQPMPKKGIISKGGARPPAKRKANLRIAKPVKVGKKGVVGVRRRFK